MRTGGNAMTTAHRPELFDDRNAVVRNPDGRWAEIDNASGQVLQTWTPSRSGIKVTIEGTHAAIFLIAPDERRDRDDDWLVGYAEQPETWVATTATHFNGVPQRTALELVSSYMLGRRITRVA